MNKYKVQFIQREKYIVDVYAESEEKAREIAEEEWNNGNYEETGDIEVEVDMVFDVTGTDDPFSPVNEYTVKYSDEIEKLIAEEIEKQKEEDRKDENFQNVTDEQYRMYAIDNLRGNNLIN